MAKYKFTYFLNTACAERRPQTRRDLIEDWKEEEREYPTALEAFEHAYIEILDNDEEDLQDLYEENGIGSSDEVKKLEALKNDFDYIDPGDGSTILISIEGEGPVDSYDSGYTKEDFNTDFEDDEDYDDDEYLDENKKLDKEKDYEEEVEDFIQQCRDSGQFDFRQMDEIKMGFYYGNNLPIEKVKIYAKPEFSGADMSTIRAGIEDGLSDEKIQFLANPDLAYFQRYQVLRGFRFGLSVEQVKTYAYLDDDAEMKERINELVKEKDKKLNESKDKKIEILQKVRDIVSNIEGFNFISLDPASVLSFNYKNKYISIKFFVEDITTNLIDCNIHLPNFGLYNELKENPKYNELIENTFKNIMRRIDVCNFDKDLSIDNLESFINNLKNNLDEYLKIISNKKDLIKFLNLEKDESKKLNETIDLKPNGGDKKNWFAFYTSNQSDSYKNNTIDNIAQFGKENLEGLKNLSIEEIKDSHIYWGTELAGFKAFYNGDTYILFDDIEKLPEDMKQDAYANCEKYKKIKKENAQLEIDEQGLPVLERPYNLRKRNDNKFQITSSHPYDMTEYSYAVSKNNDINSDWNVYDPENPRTIVSDYSAKKTTLEGTYKGWNEALDAMKRIDSNKTRRIDRT